MPRTLPPSIVTACVSHLKNSTANAKNGAGATKPGQTSQTCSGPASSSNVVGDVVTGIAAVRCGSYKAHFFTKDSPGAQACGVAGKYPEGVHSPPLMFDLVADPGESFPVDASTAAYKSALGTINAALARHVATLRPAPNQMLNNFNPVGAAMEYAVCSAPRSKETLPQWPNCTLTPEHWAKPSCARSCGGGNRGAPGDAHCLCYGKSAKTAFCRKYD